MTFSEKKAKKLLDKTARILANAQIPFWLDGGTLLLAVRDNVMTNKSHDHINIGIPGDKLDALLALEKHFKPFYKLGRDYDVLGREFIPSPMYRVCVRKSYIRSSAKTLDIRITPKFTYGTNARWVDIVTAKTAPSKHFASCNTITILGTDYPIPAFAKEYLTHRYNNYAKPQTTWNTTSDDLSIADPAFLLTLPRKSKKNGPEPFWYISNFTNKRTLARAKKLLKDATTIFEKEGIPYWLDDGTLLGLIRDKQLIPWDIDLDIGIPGEYAERVIALTLQFLPGYHVPKHRQTSDWYQGNIRATRIRSLYSKIVHDSLHMDVFFKYKIGDEYRWIDSNCKKKIECEYYDKLDTIEFEGKKYSIPSNVETYLGRRYGEGWRTPQKNFDTSRDEPVIAE